MSLNWSKLNTSSKNNINTNSSLNWSKLDDKLSNQNTTQKQQQTMPTFKTIEEAQSYAKANNLNVASSAIQVPQLVQNKPIIPSAQQVQQAEANKGGNILTNAASSALGSIKKVAQAASLFGSTVSAVGKVMQTPNAPKIAVQSAKSLGANAIDATVDVGQYVKNAFKSEMVKEERDTIEGLLKLKRGFRGTANQLSEEQAQNLIKQNEDFLKAKYKLTDTSIEALEARLNGIADWTYRENGLEKSTREMAEKVNQENQELGSVGREVANAFGTVGRMGPTIGSNLVLPGSGMAPLFLSAAESQQEKLMQQGVSTQDAVVNGILSGALEVGTEMLSGGISQNLTGISALAKVSDLTKGISNKYVKGALDVVGDVVSEGLEEVASAAVQPFIDRITYNPDAPMATGEELWANFTESILPTLLMQGGSVAVNKINQYYNGEKAAIENSNINSKAKQQMLDALAEQKDKISQQIQSLSQNNVQNVSENQETTSQNEQISQNNTQYSLNNEISTIRQSANNLQQQGLKIPENTINTFENIQSKRQGLNIVFDTEVQGNGVYNVNENGTRTVRINPNSQRALEFTLVHELGHDLKTGDTQSYQELQNYVLDYAKTKEGYELAKEALGETYAEQLGKGNYNLNDEATNDILGQALGNQEFLNSLAQNKPNIFQRIWNWFKNVLFDGNNTGKGFADRKFLNDLQNKFRTAYNQTFSNQSDNNSIQYSKQMGGYYPNINVNTSDISKFNIGNLEDLKEVKKKINDFYSDKYISNEKVSKPIKNIDTGLDIEIWKSGINETFGNDKYYKNLSQQEKKIKLATMDNLAKMIKYGEVRAQSASNYHNPNSTAQYYYLEHPITIDGQNYMVNMDIRKVPNSNGRFYIHSIKTNKVATPGNSMNRPLTVTTSNNSIPSNNNVVNNQYMQNNQNNTQNSQKSSFSLFENTQKVDEIANILDIYKKYQYEDNSIITESIDELEKQLKEIDANYTDDDFERRFEVKTKLKALEAGYKSQYDYYIGREKEQIAKNLAYDSKYYDKQLNEYNTKVQKQQKLEQEIKQATPFKRAQYQIIQESNPMFDEEHVGIRSPADIKTFEEAINEKDGFAWGDYTREDALRDLKRDKVRVYSSYAIKNGVFVSTSYQQALDYAGGDRNKVHSKEVSPSKVAWINGDEGQYASVTSERLKNNNYSQPNDQWQKFLDDNFSLMPNATRSIAEKMNKQIAEGSEALKLGKNKTKSLVDIANMTEEDVRREKGVEYKHKPDKDTTHERKFFENIESSKIIFQEVKDRVEITTYEQKANEQTLAKVNEKLDEQGDKLIREWERKTKNFTDEDVALGAILVERYQQQGDIESAVDVVQKLADMGTEAGRAVQMYSIFQRLTPEAMLVYQQRKLNDVFNDIKQKKTGEWVEKNKDNFKLTPEDAQFIQDQVTKAQQAESEEVKQRELSKIENRINDKLPPEAGQTIKALRRMAMLFNPKTQVRNIVGNSLIMPVNATADFIGTQIDKAIAKKTGVRTTNYTNLADIGKGAVKGIKDAVTDYKTGTRTTESGSKYEFEIGAKAFNENTNSKTLNAINNKLNGINNLLSAVMSGGDRPFYEAAYRNSLEGQMKANNVTTPTQDMIDIAVNEALQRTWNDNNKYTQAVLNFRKSLNDIASIHGFGLGDMIIPFAKTPANLTKAMVEYSPAGFIESLIDYNDMRKAISRGEMTPQQQKKFVTSTSKAIAGTLLYAIAGTLVKSGAVTGSKDKDKDVANFEQNVLGIQPYSIKIGNRTYTYSWANPINFPLAVMADTYKMSKEKAKLSEILLNALKVGGDTLLENSFLSGVQEVLGNSYNSSDSFASRLWEQVLKLPESFVPTLFSQFANLGDDTKRQSYEKGDSIGSRVNAIKAKIPGLKNTLAPSVNTFGEEIKNYGGDNNPFNVFLNPANVSETVATDTQKELYALYEVTKDKTIFPRQIPYSEDGKNFTSKERAEYQKISGKYVSENLGALFDSNFYKTLNNDEKTEVVNKIVSDGYQTARSEWIKNKTTQDLSKLKEKLDNVPLVDYYNAWMAQKDVESDKDSQGKTIQLSKAKKQKEAIDNAVSDDLTKEQKEILYGIFNISEKVW